jgi:hypothetical protein
MMPMTLAFDLNRLATCVALLLVAAIVLGLF